MTELTRAVLNGTEVESWSFGACIESHSATQTPTRTLQVINDLT